jgi:hypothetical protein
MSHPVTDAQQALALETQRLGASNEPHCLSYTPEGAPEGLKVNGAFQGCRTAPVYDNYSLSGGACANCIWNRKGKQCSFRQLSGVKLWDDAFNK